MAPMAMQPDRSSDDREYRPISSSIQSPAGMVFALRSGGMEMRALVLRILVRIAARFDLVLVSRTGEKPRNYSPERSHAWVPALPRDVNEWFAKGTWRVQFGYKPPSEFPTHHRWVWSGPRRPIEEYAEYEKMKSRWEEVKKLEEDLR